jgi:lipoic acid synthetase
MNRLPAWLKQKLPSRDILQFSHSLKEIFNLNTVCHSAKCPNRWDCFSRKHATFLILGSRCTRDCKFCNIEKFDIKAKQDSCVDSYEPFRISQAVRYYNLEYVVITSVTRDDLGDGGAGHFVETIAEIRRQNAGIKIEVLIPDFRGSRQSLESVVRCSPEVIAHNLETVRKLYPLVRDKADYDRSLELLKNIKSLNPAQKTKSSIMLGLGESEGDLREALSDLRSVDCDMLVLGQYLRPSLNQYPVNKFYTPEEFKLWQEVACDLGFKSVCAFPFARTSFLASEQEKCMTSL